MISNPVPELRPLTIGQIVDRGLRIYRNNFLIFVGIVAITQIPTLLVGLLAIFITGDPGDIEFILANSDRFLGFALIAVLISLVGWVLTQIASAAVVKAAAETHLGQKIGLIEAYQRVRNDWTTLIVASIVSILFAILLFVWFLVPCVGWFTGFGMIWFYSSVVVPMLIPIVIFEKRSSADVIFRAWDLARRKFWWVLGFTILLGLFGVLISEGPTALVQLGLTAAIGAGENEQLLLIIQQVVTSIIGILYLPIPLICFTLLYMDLRVKTEGLDLMLAEVNDPDSEVSIDKVLVNSSIAQNWRPTGEEMGNFLGISIAVLGFAFVMNAIFEGLLPILLSSF